jgi:hypothetical protein
MSDILVRSLRFRASLADQAAEATGHKKGVELPTLVRAALILLAEQRIPQAAIDDALVRAARP